MKQKRIAVFVAATIFIVLINWFCSKSKSTSAGGSNHPSGNSITIVNMAFGPATLTVKTGTTLTWKNNDDIAHTVTSNDGTTFDSGTLAAGARFSFTANTAGTYAYHCTIHSGMTATLIVTN